MGRHITVHGAGGFSPYAYPCEVGHWLLNMHQQCAPPHSLKARLNMGRWDLNMGRLLRDMGRLHQGCSPHITSEALLNSGEGDLSTRPLRPSLTNKFPPGPVVAQVSRDRTAWPGRVAIFAAQEQHHFGRKRLLCSGWPLRDLWTVRQVLWFRQCPCVR